MLKWIGADLGEHELNPRVIVERRKHVKQARHRGDVVGDHDHCPGRCDRHPALGADAHRHRDVSSVGHCSSLLSGSWGCWYLTVADQQ